MSPPLGFDPRTVQPLALRYTVYAILAAVRNNRQETVTHIAEEYRYVLWLHVDNLPVVYLEPQ